MLRVPIAQALPGMKLAVSLHHPQQPGRVLLKAGYQLDAGAIQRLREIELKELWILYPSLAFVGEYINPAVVTLRHEMIAALDTTFERVAGSEQADIEYEEFRNTINDLIEQFVEQPRAALYIDEICAGGKTHISHAGNVCALSLLMGLKLRGYLVTQRARLTAKNAMKIVDLGVGAMLHDIGMLKLDPEVLDRWAHSGDESDPEWREHAVLGYRMVRERVGPSAASVVLNHHQRYDGTGFPVRDEQGGAPRGRRGDEIPVFSRIVAAADVYDRLRNPPDGAGSRPAVQALSMMFKNPWVARFDPMILKALVSIAPPYAPGTIVELSDGRTGVVTSWPAADPCRPTVQTMDAPTAQFDAEEVESATVDLQEQTDLHIASTEGVDVSAHNFFAKRPDDYDVDEAQARQWRAGDEYFSAA